MVDLKNGLPFLIGITGHRDICKAQDQVAIDEFKEQLKAIFSYWQAQAGKHTPLWILTGLASGADLIAAEAALELQGKSNTNQIRIYSCLPMPLENFQWDFTDNNDYANHEEQQHWLQKQKLLLGKLASAPNSVFEVKNALGEDAYQKAITSECQEMRNSLYLNQGLFIAKYCNVLVSLWDRETGRGSGGTADVVNYKLGKPVNWPPNTENPSLQPISGFDGQTSGLVHLLPVTRLSRTKPEEIPGDTTKNNYAEFDPEAPPPCGVLYSHFASDRQDSGFLQQFLSTEFATLLKEIDLHNGSILECSEKVSPRDIRGLGNLTGIFAAADEVAQKWQSRYRRLVMAFFLIATPGYILYEIAGNYVSSKLGFDVLLAILLVILVCWALINHSARKNLKWRYQLTRGVAEAMRIRGHLNEADIPPSSVPLIPRRYRLQLPLLNHAANVAELTWWQNTFTYNREAIKQSWLHNQISFLSERLERKASSLSQLIYKRPAYASSLMSRWARAFFYAAIAFGLSLIVNMASIHFGRVSMLDSINSTLMLLLQYSLTAAGLTVLWSELSGYDEAANGYENLQDLYLRALHLLENECSHDRQQVLLELAREAINEHVTWTSSEKNNDLKQRR